MKKYSPNIRHEIYNIDINHALDKYLNDYDEEVFLDNYEAIVVDNNDLEKKGRVKVRIYAFHSSLIQNSELPWAVPHNSSMITSYGSICIPEIGSKIYIKFNNGDIYLPEYIINIPQKNQLPPYRLIDYPNNVIMMETKLGTRINYNRKKNSITVKHSSGTSIEIDTIGKITITGNIINIKGLTGVGGAVQPNPAGGPFNCLPLCPLTGLAHQGCLNINT